MDQLTILNPVAAKDQRLTPPVPRPTSLDGITLGLVWNGKPGGDVALEFLGDYVQSRFNNVRILKLYDDIPLGQETIDRGIAKCQAVIGSTGD